MESALRCQELAETKGGDLSDPQFRCRRLEEYENISGPAVRVTSPSNRRFRLSFGHQPDSLVASARPRGFRIPFLTLILTALALCAATPVGAQNAPTGKVLITHLSLIHLGYELRWQDVLDDDTNLVRDTSVTGYDIQYRVSGTTSWTDFSHIGTAWVARITGLTASSEYQVRVRKTNAGGNGPWSDIEDGLAVQSYNSIDPPSGLRVTPGNTKATFFWQAPAHTAGTTITGYRIRVRGATATSTFSTSVEVSGATTTSGEVTGLTNGTEYEGTVQAVHASGFGRFANWQPFTPKASTRQVSFAQSSYTVSEGASVTLTVNISPALTTAGSVTVNTHTIGTTAESDDYSLTGLTGISLTLPANATTATFTVAAATDSSVEGPEKIEFVLLASTSADYIVSGTGDTTVVTIGDETLAKPTNLVVAPGNAKLDLSWTAPMGTVTGYDVHYTSATASSVTDSAAASGTNAATAWVAVSRGTEMSPPTASQSISSLTNSTAYRVRVRAKNSSGNSAWAFGTGTPTNKNITIAVSPTSVKEGGNVTVTVTLGEAVPSTATEDLLVDFTVGSVEGLTSISAGESSPNPRLSAGKAYIIDRDAHLDEN